jgi:hypothetical protein
VFTAIDMGWAASAVLGAVLLVLAWRVSLSRSAMVLRILMGSLGAGALVGALFDLFS